jgi:peptidoglycan hydrolase-like protein with peptidoglycan-binding domain
MQNNSDVKCLQEFFKNQGTDIYPEGLVTGNFGSLTKAAAIKFQAKYGISQTGYVGILTRTKINQILNGG